MTYPYQWKTEYSVGICRIDEQHKKIIELLNILFGAIFEGKAREAVVGVVGEIALYAEYHFATEESLMKEYHYPETDYNEHIKEHDEFRAKAVGLQRSVREGKKSMTVDVVALLTNWLEHHIMTIDKKYGPFLNEKGVF